MHTPSEVWKRARRPCFSATVALLLIGVLSPALCQSFPGAGSGPQFNIRPYPLDLWGPRVGPGIGLGLVAHNVGRQHARWLLSVAPALHEQVAVLSAASSNPRRSRWYVVMNARGMRTTRSWFYGLGPASAPSSRVAFDRRTVWARLQGGYGLGEGRLRVQPYVSLRAAETGAVRGPLQALRPASRAEVQRRLDSPVQTGVRIGADVRYDTRDRHQRPVQGVLLRARWSRYVGVSGPDVDFHQTDLQATGYVHLGAQHRIVLRSLITITRSWGRSPPPFYELPVLDGSLVPGWQRSRYVASDRAIMSMLYRFPLLDSDLFVLGGHAGIHAASVYSNLQRQFVPKFSFDKQLAPSRVTYPLRPAVSVGLQFGIPLRPRTVVDLAVGVTPEGAAAVRFSVGDMLDTLAETRHTTRVPR